jgi:UDP-N-acetylglucosamine 4,6-dehydratase
VGYSLDGKFVLITGATGSFGRKFLELALRETSVAKLIVFSRDELKQLEVRNMFPDEDRLRFVIGDVRDRDRLYRTFNGVDVVIHAAALKQIPAAEYNPFEFVQTNVIGAQNVIDAAIDNDVERVVALSTDKASSAINVYGATKLVSDKLFIAGNVYVGKKPVRFSIVRCGNLIGSRGSVVPHFKEQAKTGKLAVTDPSMTRFWTTPDRAVQMVFDALEVMDGGEIYVPKIPSMRIAELAKALAPDAEIEITGIRPGEKMHEEMIGPFDARRTLDCGSHYVILPEVAVQHGSIPKGDPVPAGFSYSSETNDEWLDAAGLRAMLGD